ncbi:MAG TPA: hypothetical protein VJ753_07670 [Rhizomicrobium sp.]|nr:hypothetical protein [Rhizomicrobium sp.]
MKALLLLVVAMVLSISTSNAANVQVVATIAALRAITAASAATIGDIQVADYYGTRTGCPIYYHWNASDSSADNGGAIINPTGNSGSGRWNLNLPPKSPVHSCVFGVFADVTPSSGSGTDQTTQMQALLTWANTSGPNWVHIDGTVNKCIRINTTLTPGQGQIIQGDGEMTVTSSSSYGTCISFLGSTGWVFQLQTPYPGSGLTPYEAPKFRDFTILYGPTDTGPGGCFQLNSIAGGFTDTNASQQPLMHPQFTNLYCSMPQINNSTKIAVQCSKCADGWANQMQILGGNIGFDIEGSENFSIENGTIAGTFGPNIKLARQNTFGNNNRIHGMQLLGFANFGQTVDSHIYDDARSSTIANNLFESLNGVTLSSNIHLVDGFTATITGNQITGTSTNWLVVDGVYQGITAYSNLPHGAPMSVALFKNGKYLYDSNGIQSILNHSGNGNEGGWPFVSLPGVPATVPKVQEIYSPNYPGLNGNGYGPSEIPINYSFAFPVTGSANFLDFNPNSLAPTKGTLDAQIRAWQTNGTGQITCQLTDGGSLIGSSIAQNITTVPQWYTLTFSQVISTNAGIRCWDTGGSSSGNPSRISQINIVDH